MPKNWVFWAEGKGRGKTTGKPHSKTTGRPTAKIKDKASFLFVFSAPSNGGGHWGLHKKDNSILNLLSMPCCCFPPILFVSDKGVKGCHTFSKVLEGLASLNLSKHSPELFASIHHCHSYFRPSAMAFRTRATVAAISSAPTNSDTRQQHFAPFWATSPILCSFIPPMAAKGMGIFLAT